MSKIQINADIESTEITFDYAGKDLVAPLAALHEHLTSEAKTLMARTGVKSADLPTVADLRRPDPDSEAKQKIRLALSDAFEARLWANEAKRTPEKVWKLTMSKLRWLYREMAP